MKEKVLRASLRPVNVNLVRLEDDAVVISRIRKNKLSLSDADRAIILKINSSRSLLSTSGALKVKGNRLLSDSEDYDEEQQPVLTKLASTLGLSLNALAPGSLVQSTDAELTSYSLRSTQAFNATSGFICIPSNSFEKLRYPTSADHFLHSFSFTDAKYVSDSLWYRIKPRIDRCNPLINGTLQPSCEDQRAVKKALNSALNMFENVNVFTIRALDVSSNDIVADGPTIVSNCASVAGGDSLISDTNESKIQRSSIENDVSNQLFKSLAKSAVTANHRPQKSAKRKHSVDPEDEKVKSKQKISLPPLKKLQPNGSLGRSVSVPVSAPVSAPIAQKSKTSNAQIEPRSLIPAASTSVPDVHPSASKSHALVPLRAVAGTLTLDKQQDKAKDKVAAKPIDLPTSKQFAKKFTQNGLDLTARTELKAKVDIAKKQQKLKQAQGAPSTHAATTAYSELGLNLEPLSDVSAPEASLLPQSKVALLSQSEPLFKKGERRAWTPKHTEHDLATSTSRVKEKINANPPRSCQVLSTLPQVPSKRPVARARNGSGEKNSDLVSSIIAQSSSDSLSRACSSTTSDLETGIKNLKIGQKTAVNVPSTLSITSRQNDASDSSEAWRQRLRKDFDKPRKECSKIGTRKPSTEDCASLSYRSPLLKMSVDRVLETSVAATSSSAFSINAEAIFAAEHVAKRRNKLSVCWREPIEEVRFAPVAAKLTQKTFVPIAELPIQDRFELQMLRWNPSWLVEYTSDKTKQQDIPPLFTDSNLAIDDILLPAFFETFPEYADIFLALLLLETWDKISTNYNNSMKSLSLIQTHVSERDHFVDITFQGLAAKGYKVFQQDWLLSFNIDRMSFFGIVRSIQETPNISDLARDVPFLVRKFYDKPQYNNNLRSLSLYVVELRARNKSNLPQCFDKQLTELRPICNLVPSLREVSALENLNTHSMRLKILNPPLHSDTFLLQSVPEDGGLNSQEFNPAQTDVILSCCSSIFHDEEKIGLIHGPPGTGKSKTIIGILEEVQKRKVRLNTKGVILVTAPSNAAIDQLTRCLAAMNRKLRENDRQFCNFIRLGNENIMAEDVRSHSIDSLVKKNFLLDAHATKKEKVLVSGLSPDQLADYKEAKKERDECLNKLRQLLVLSKAAEESVEIQRVRYNLQNLDRICGNYEKADTSTKSTFVAQQEMPMPGTWQYNQRRTQLVANADVLLCTLNSSGLQWLENVLSDINILAVIVDESCQATEVETLIPLRFSTKRLFLVGDPRQLQATVISQIAKDKDFGRSLFQRLVDCFPSYLPSKSPIKLLNRQYRMVPEIALFPNKHFYDGNIADDSSIAFAEPQLPFKPYAIFDLSYGEESKGHSSSYSSAAEVQFVEDLLSLITDKTEIALSDIGIITPYVDQQREIRTKLNPNNKLQGVEVNTVDGFQGREKKIICLSCVRSSGIGFLADARRLNVAITRAQLGLYIIGNTKLLKGNENWRALLNDAADRGLIVRVPMNQNHRAAISSFLTLPAFPNRAT